MKTTKAILFLCVWGAIIVLIAGTGAYIIIQVIEFAEQMGVAL